MRPRKRTKIFYTPPLPPPSLPHPLLPQYPLPCCTFTHGRFNVHWLQRWKQFFVDPTLFLSTVHATADPHGSQAMWLSALPSFSSVTITALVFSVFRTVKNTKKSETQKREGGGGQQVTFSATDPTTNVFKSFSQHNAKYENNKSMNQKIKALMYNYQTIQHELNGQLIVTQENEQLTD